jgi:hypothetical protein
MNILYLLNNFVQLISQDLLNTVLTFKILLRY